MSNAYQTRPKSPATREQTEPQGSKDQIAKKKSIECNNNNNDTNKEKGSAKHAAAASSASAAAPRFYCRACARVFHSSSELARHLESHQHSLLQAAYSRGALMMSELAVRMTRLALEHYPHPTPAHTALSAEDAEFAERMQRLLLSPGPNAAATLLLLQHSMQHAHDAGIARSFCAALAAGQRSLVDWLQRETEAEIGEMFDDGDYDEDGGEEGDEGEAF